MKKLPARRYFLFFVALWLGSSGVGMAVDPTEAHSQWRWIGLLRAGEPDCPEPPRAPDPTIGPETETAEGPDVGTTFRYKSGTQPWSTRKLFTAVDGQLHRFCVYEFEPGETVDSDDVDRLESLITGALERIEPDRMAVTSSGVIGDQIWPSLRDFFYRQAGALRTGDPQSDALQPPDHEDPWPPPPTGKASRLVVLDTAATGDDLSALPPGCSPHGVTLLHMAQDLLCNDVFCMSEIASRLTMGHKSFDPDVGKLRDDNGGLVGLIGELAEAIEREVSFSQQLPGSPNLVLNVSAGWDGELFGGGEQDVDQMPLAVQAVYRAISYASCEGVLVIAAAGNKSCGPQERCGPFFPAAWEEELAPSCGSSAPYSALVYAAGSVDGMGRAAITTLPGGYAALQAYGDHAVVESGASDVPTATLTGSSVATLVVSATAAAVWAYRPGWDHHKVIDTVYRRGDRLDRVPELCLDGSGSAVCSAERPVSRRVSLCPALAAACRGCVVCPEWRPAAVQLPNVTLSNAIDLYVMGPEPCPDEGCSSYDGPASPSGIAPKPSAYCPDQTFPCRTRTPWVYPQPGTTICPSCSCCSGGANLRVGGKALTAAGTASAYVEIEVDGIAGESNFELRDPVLRMCDEYYPVAFVQGDSALRPNNTAIIHNVPMNGCRQMELLFTVYDYGPTREPFSSAVVPILVGNIGGG